MRLLLTLLLAASAACSSEPTTEVVDPGPEVTEIPQPTAEEGECVVDLPGAYIESIGCFDDFEKLAKPPNDASIPGALSVKVVIDREDNDSLYFVNTRAYALHYTFIIDNLSGNGLPEVPPRDQFSRIEYYTPQRRFILATLTFYQEPSVWALELVPDDTASTELIELLHRKVAQASYFGGDVLFHPTSDALVEQARDLPDSAPYIRTETLFAGISYQALNLAEAYGRLRIIKASELATQYLGFRDIVVLDRTPNDISVVSGIITQDFQTPLSHINVLSQNRGTPNMSLRGAHDNDDVRALDGKWVRLEVEPFDYTLEEVSFEQAEAWWEENKPPAVSVPRLDRSERRLLDIDRVVDEASGPRREAIKNAIPAFGGKASHYSSMAHIPEVRHPEAFGVPVYYYLQFMEQHGFDDRVRDMLADSRFRSDPALRDEQLAALRADMLEAPVDDFFLRAVEQKIRVVLPGHRARFRSSTNAEDLDGFTGAGLYTSQSGDLDDPLHPIEDAIREVWSSVWYFRAFEEREYRSIDHLSVGMALLVHCAFTDEEANGVALTANPYGALLRHSFYVNVQPGEESVVKPLPGVSSDQYIHYFYAPAAPRVFLAHSSLVEPGETVLTEDESMELGEALDAIHRYFRPAYDMPNAFYGMEVEFKIDDIDGKRRVWVKQARPHPGRGQ